MRCNSCGLMFVSPRIKDDIVNLWYEEYLSGKYKDYIIEYKVEDREKIFVENLKFIEQYITDPSKKGNLLDIGCASGGFLNIAKKLVCVVLTIVALCSDDLIKTASPAEISPRK